MPEHDKSLDVLGLKPVADAVSTVTSATTDGVGAFLSRICLPAAEEFGLLLRDKVSSWRANNAITIAQKAEKKLQDLPNPDRRHAHPRLVGLALEQGSWVDDDLIQEMWAGLLATGCTENGGDQTNILFANMLSPLTPSQAKALRFSCMRCQMKKSSSGLIAANLLVVTVEELLSALELTDIHRLDLELDHLRGAGLLDMQSGLDPNETSAYLCPTSLGIQLFIRSEGYVGSPIEYFGLQ